MDKHLNKKVTTIFWITIVGFFGAIAFHLLLSLKNNSYPYNTFLFIKNARFSDFTIVLQESLDRNPYLGNNSAQYPLLCFTGHLLAKISHYGIRFKIFYFTYVITCFSAFAYIVNKLNGPGKKIFSTVAICLIFLASYPFLFAVDRGNFELLVFVIAAASLYAYKIENFYQAGFFLACAASMKLFPLYYLVIFMKDKKYKEIAFAIGCFIAINLAVLSLFKGGLDGNLRYLVNGGNVNNNAVFSYFTDGSAVFQRSVSLYNFLKILLANYNMLDLYKTFDIFLYYKMFMLILVGVLSLFIIFVVKDFLVAVTISTVVVILLPYISADYKMLYLFLPILFFLKNDGGRFQNAYSVLFGLAIIPKSYYFLGLLSETGVPDISVSSILNPLMLTALLLMALYESGQQALTDRSDKRLIQ